MRLKMKCYQLILVVLIFAGCVDQAKSNFTIEGKIVGDVPSIIYLDYGNVKDSSEVINNEFRFSGKVLHPSLARLTIHPVSTIENPFYIENSDMRVHITVRKKNFKKHLINFIEVDSVFGSETARIRADFEKFREKKEKQADWSDSLYDKLEVVIRNNPSNQFSGDLLAEMTKASYLKPAQVELLFNELDTTLQSKISTNTIRNFLDTTYVLKVGASMLNFSLYNTKGITVNTENYRGSTLLLSFWASWCLPCRKEHPDLLKLYDQYRDKNFQILGVSIDTKDENWISAIEKDSLTWQNVIDKRGVNSDILTRYGASMSVPQNFLVDKDGKIIAKNISIENLKQFLKEN